MSTLLKIIFFLGFVIVVPVILFSMLLVLIEDGLPVIFIQKRVGRNKKIINIYKIRTMKKNTPNLGTHEVNNSDYLKFGLILRSLKIDELPQLINFFKGEINLIGPRPCLPNQIDLINQREVFDIYSINPGITGLSQILGYDMSNPEALAKVDAIYLKNKSLVLDLKIFMATFFKFIRKKIKKNFNKELSLINGM